MTCVFRDNHLCPSLVFSDPKQSVSTYFLSPLGRQNKIIPQTSYGAKTGQGMPKASCFLMELH